MVAELGYDRLTMDAVATAAKASKATLYRRWTTKAELVVDAISRAKGCPIPDDVDTGSLRGDLISMSCGDGGFTDELPMSVIAGLLTALHRDPELQTGVPGTLPRAPAARSSPWSTSGPSSAARSRPDVDVELLSVTLPAVIVHHAYLLGVEPTDELILRVIDNVILPAARGSHAS